MKILKSPLFIFGAFFLLPLIVFADPLVPCGTASFTDYVNATSCNFCYLAQLIQNIVNFLIMVAIPISVAMFAWAGIKFFTSAGNPKNIAQAKRIFSSVFIGFLIAISGWLLVQIVLQTITRSSFYIGSNWLNVSGGCNNLNAESQRPRNQSIGNVLNGNGLTSVSPPVAADVVVTSSVSSSNACNGTTCTNESARSTIDTYNANAGSNVVNSAPGVNYAGVDPGLVQSVINNTSIANDGTVTVTSAERPGAVTTNGTQSNHATGDAVDVGTDNAQFNSYIRSLPSTANPITGGNDAYRDSSGYVWSYEPATTAGSTGNHWHVSKTGN